MKNINKNTFYKSTTIDKAIAVKPNFPDLPWGGTDETITIKSGLDPTFYMISGAIPSTPKYGESEMVGGYLSVYVSGVSMPSVPQLPQFELYRTKEGIGIEEGTMRIAYESGTTTNDEVGQNITVYRSTVAEDHFFAKENFDGADKTIGEVKMVSSLGNGTVELGDAYLEESMAEKKAKSLGNIFSQRQGFALRKYFTEDESPGVPIYPESGDVNGVWRPKVDKRKGQKKAIWSLPWWKYKNIKGHIKFNQKTPVSSDLDSAPLATKGNTIFDEVYATQDMNNPFTSDVNNPLVMTSCELSTAKKYSGGQAFRMYHLWDYSTESPAVQKALGVNALMPTMTRASIYDIPRPHWGLDSAMPSILGWQSAFAPCMEMRMNISKLQYNPYLSCVNDGAGTAYGSSSSYLYYTQSTVASTTLDTELLTGLFRCVAITWSNYKPKSDHTTLDAFLDYGLDRFYSGSGSEHVVGGLIFQRTGIDMPTSGDSNMFVSALPVTEYYDGDLTTTTSKLLASGGLAKMTSISSDMSQTLNLATDDWQIDIPSWESVQQRVIPMDSWFNMKVYYDGFAQNSGKDATGFTSMSAQKNLYNGNGTSLERAGAPMRAYFYPDVVASGQTTSTELDNIPYVDIYFPCTSGASSGSASAPSQYNFNNDRAMYPMHMTVWVQNYRWLSGSTSDASFNTSRGVFRWGDNDGAFPSGAAIEAEVFIDDINFFNWTPEVTNCSAGASITSQRTFATSQEGQISPFTYFSTGAGASKYTTRSWAVSGAALSGNMERRQGHENLIIGFDSPSQLPNADDYANDAWGYILCNGFSTTKFDSLERILPTAFISVSGTDINQDKLGASWFGSHWINDANEATALGTGSTLSGSKINSTNDGATSTLSSAPFPPGNLNMMTGTTSSIPSQDGLTSKGLMRFAVSGSGFDDDTTWTKRENIMAATKIVGVPGHTGRYGTADTVLNNNQIIVKNTGIFNKYIDEEYIIFQIGQNMPSAGTDGGNAYTKGWGDSSLKLGDDAPIDDINNVVTFDGSVISADSGSDNMCVPDKLKDLWISPKKYWLNLFWQAAQVQRSYKNFCVVQNVDTDGTSNIEPTAASLSGTTWNEGIYSYDSGLRSSVGQSGLYLRPWNLEPSTDESSLITNIDYGFGTWDEETQDGGEISQATALIDNWVYLDMMELAKLHPPPEENIVFRLGLNDNTGTQTITLYSDEYTDDVGKAPIMYWEYKDNLPKIVSPLKVEPNFNILSGSGGGGKVDLYTLDREDLNAVKFTWEEEGDDILYRLLYVDTNPINDKYDGIYFHAPINEVPGTSSTTTGTYYTNTVPAGTAFDNSTLRHITGSSGWAFAGTGTNYGPESADGWTSPWFDASEATFIAHCIPNITGAAGDEYIFSDYTSTHGSFQIKVNKADAAANTDVTPIFTLVSGNGAYSGKEVTLTSDYSFPNNGESPLFIVVTFNAVLPENNIKMYVNGILVKQSAGNWETDEAIYDGTSYGVGGKLSIGRRYDYTDTLYWKGTIQECIVHQKALHVPTEANEYILSNDYLPDMSSGTELKYNARLFLFDYHNIIGSNTDTVCTSNQVSWEATGI